MGPKWNNCSVKGWSQLRCRLYPSGPHRTKQGGGKFRVGHAREPIPLARGALLIAKEEYADLNTEKYLDDLATLAREAEPAVRSVDSTVEKIQSLSEFLFTRKGFEGNREQYGDPRNSFLNDV